MTCLRCQGATQRILTRIHPAVGVWAMQVVTHEPLICQACLDAWAAKPPFLIPPEWQVVE